MNNIAFTMKDLVVDYSASNFATAFGIEEVRAREIAGILDKIANEVRMQPTWSPAQIFKKAADVNLAMSPKEVAFVTYLVGCRVGEDTVYQGAMKKFTEMVQPPFPPIKKGKYVN